MENNSPPQVFIGSSVVDINERVSLTSRFSVSDPDPNSQVFRYQFRDNGVGGGRFLRNGIELAANVWHEIAPADLAQIEYEGADSKQSETFSMRVNDGIFWSNIATGLITTGNSSPVVIANGSRVGASRLVQLTDLFTVFDADSDPIQGYYIVDRNTEAGGGQFINAAGNFFTQGAFHFFSAAEISTVYYRGADSGPRSENIGIYAFDGFSLSALTEFPMLTSAKPTVSVFGGSLLNGQAKVATDIFVGQDADNDAIQSYLINDYTTGADSGYWWFQGQRMEAATWFSVNASELGQLFWFAAQTGPRNEQVGVMPYDGFEFGDITNFNISTEAVPVVSGNDSFIRPNHYLNMLTGGTSPISGTMPAGNGSVVDAFDADGDSIDRYMFNTFQTGDFSGQFYFNGAPVPRAQYFSIAASELGQLEYRAGTFGLQTNDVSALVLANNSWSEIDFFQITTLANEFNPTLTVNSATADLGTVFPLSALFSATDADGDLIQTVSVYDTGTASASGFVSRDGVPIAAGQWHQFNYADLDRYQYHFANQASNEIIRFQVSDGSLFSTIESATMVANPTPTMTTAANDLSLNTLESVSAGSLIQQTDTGLPFTRYEVFDEGLLPQSGRLFLRDPGPGNNGELLQQGVVHTLTAEQFSRLEFQGAQSDFGRSLDPMIIRATNDATGWTRWHRINVNTDPVGALALETDFHYTDIRDPNVVTITYTFNDGNASPIPNYYVCRPAPNPDEECNTAGEEIALNRDQRIALREVLASFESIANVDFVEVPYEESASSAAITFGAANPSPNLRRGPTVAFGAGHTDVGFFGPEDVANANGTYLGDIWFDRGSFDPNTNTDVGLGSAFRRQAFEVIAGALGLGNPNRSPNPLSIFMEFDYNTVMANIRDNGNNPIGFHPEVPTSLNLYDIVQLQNIYGANTNFRAGNDNYGNFYAGSTPHFVNNDESHQTTLWDAGGVDALNYTLHVDNESIDLRQGQFSTINGVPQSLRIAYGTVIENAYGGAGNDTITGNEINNLMFGNGGNDTFFGLGGDDTFRGGAGNDIYNWSLGDGYDIVQEMDAGGIDELKVFNPTGELIDFRGNIEFTKDGSNMFVNLRFEGRESQGGILLSGFGSQASQVELMSIHNQFGNQIGNKLDLTSVWASLPDDSSAFYQITGTPGANGGFIGVPA